MPKTSPNHRRANRQPSTPLTGLSSSYRGLHCPMCLGSFHEPCCPYWKILGAPELVTRTETICKTTPTSSCSSGFGWSSFCSSGLQTARSCHIQAGLSQGHQVPCLSGSENSSCGLRKGRPTSSSTLHDVSRRAAAMVGGF